MASDSGHNWLANTDITKNMFENSFDHAAAFNSKAETLSLSNIDADSLNSLLRLEMAMTIPNQMMVKVDKTSMDAGLEVRSPFLDKDVIEKAFSIPGKDKLRLGQGKTILREIFKNDLPDHLLKQRKRGFDLPVNEWLVGPLASNLKDALCPEFQASVGIRKEVVEGWMSAAKLKGGSAASNNLWTLMGLKIWCENRGQ